MLLLVTYRSPVLWLLPVISAGVALASAQAVIYLLAKHAGLTVNAQSAGHPDRAGLRRRHRLRPAADRAVPGGTAPPRGPARGDGGWPCTGPARRSSRAPRTVMLGMLVLIVAELNSTSGLGPVLAIGIVVGAARHDHAAAGAAGDLRPLGVLAGPARGSARPSRPAAGFWARVGRAIARRPRIVWIGTALVLGVMALGLTGLNASGLTKADSFREHPDSVAGEQVLARHFPAGAGQPVIVIGNQPARPRSCATAFARGAAGSPRSRRPRSKAGHAYLEGTLTAAPDSQAAYDDGRPGAGRRARRARRGRQGRRQHRDQPRHATRRRARRTG